MKTLKSYILESQEEYLNPYLWKLDIRGESFSSNDKVTIIMPKNFDLNKKSYNDEDPKSFIHFTPKRTDVSINNGHLMIKLIPGSNNSQDVTYKDMFNQLIRNNKKVLYSDILFVTKVNGTEYQFKVFANDSVIISGPYKGIIDFSKKVKILWGPKLQ